MKYILKINGLVELLAGLLLLANPNGLLLQKSIDLSAASVSKLYGILAFFFGIVTYLLSTEFSYSQVYKKIILAVITFHLLVALYLYGIYVQGVLSHIGSALFHLILACSFLVLYYREMTMFDTKQ